MNTRTLLDGQEVQDHNTPITLEVYTKCPEKWMLIDMQTGEKYIGQMPCQDNLHWSKVDV